MDKYYFVFNMPVTKGVSGSPVICKDDEEFKIVGLHAKNMERLIKTYHASLKLRVEIIDDVKENFNYLCYMWNGSK